MCFHIADGNVFPFSSNVFKILPLASDVIPFLLGALWRLLYGV